jgi:DNA-binding ferritin-like protein
MATNNGKKGKLNDEREAQLQLYEMTQLQLREVTDSITERNRKAGGTPPRSISHSAHLQRLADKDLDQVDPSDLLSRLSEDNLSLAVAGTARRRPH